MLQTLVSSCGNAQQLWSSHGWLSCTIFLSGLSRPLCMVVRCSDFWLGTIPGLCLLLPSTGHTQQFW